MHEFELWASHKGISSLDVVIGDVAYPMARGEHNWWRCRVAGAGPGTAYQFRINGDAGQIFPDPRSRWQPEGTHGPSTIVDHTYGWTDGDWQPRPLAEAALYEMHIGTFTQAGTYLAAIEKLTYLTQLGVTHIELMPLHQASGMRGWGYDGVYLYAPYAAYGTPGELRQFVDQAHAHGLAVILDVVYNHFGPDGDHTCKFGSYTKDDHTPWGQAVNLDGPGSDPVRAFILDNALMWLEDYHFDGLRIDAMDELRDRSATHIMEELCERVDALSQRLGRHLVVTAEFDQNDPRVVTARDKGGLGLDAQWADNFHHALMTVLSGDNRGYYRDFGTLDLLAKALRQAIVFDGQYSGYRDKRLGRSYGQTSPDHFIVFNANHDQIGNRPLGDRPAHRIGADRVRIATALTILSRFVPMLFQGEEWGADTPFQYFTDHRDPDIAEAAIKGRTGSFSDYGVSPDQIPNPQALETFQRSKLDWSELEHDRHKATLAWHRNLLALRHSIRDFGRSHAAEVTYDAGKMWLTVAHSGVAVICNLAETWQSVPWGRGDMSLILASMPECKQGEGTLTMPGNAVAVLATGEVRSGLPMGFGQLG